MSQFNKVQTAILVALGENEEWCYPYKYLESQTGYEREELKPEVKKLRDLGYVEFHRGLMDEEGMVAGSGFGLNYQKWREVRDVIEATPEKQRQVLSEMIYMLQPYDRPNDYRKQKKDEVMKQIEKYVAVLMTAQPITNKKG